MTPRQAASAGDSSSQPFVTASGGQMWRSGRPYRFVGANFWYGLLLDAGRLERELDRLSALSVTNLRVLGAIEELPPPSAHAQPAVQPRPGEFDEALLAGLDRLLCGARDRGMTVVLVLNNMWQWSGGFASYVHWATGEAPPPMRSGASDEEWQAHQAYATRFYSTPAARALYYRCVRMLASRLNTCSGRRYADDPTILAWELANEARCARDVPESTREYPTTLAWGLAWGLANEPTEAAERRPQR
mmetsp:Transcript_45886/g.144314  ORF Transcript_45886/g.144314 Transcript_45886/m.144314 type:complete len:246 (-) Transcript_45886:123-860(-)